MRQLWVRPIPWLVVDTPPCKLRDTLYITVLNSVGAAAVAEGFFFSRIFLRLDGADQRFFTQHKKAPPQVYGCLLTKIK